MITKDTVVTFQTSRPMKMVYTLDGTTPTPASAVYTEPIKVSGNLITEKQKVPYVYENTPESLAEMGKIINVYVQGKHHALPPH